MSELGDVAARLAELSDTEIAAVIRQATAGRPSLAALHSAASGVASGPTVPEPTETLPEVPEPAIPSSLDVPPPVRVPTTRRINREKVGEDKMEEIRASLRRTIRPER